MSVTYTAMVPIAVSPAGGTGAINPVNMTPTSPCAEGDIVVLSGSGIAPAAANVANGIVGIAQHDSSLNYGGQSPTSTFNPNLLLGISNVGTLMPASPGQTIVAKLGAPTLVEINLTVSTGWISGGTQQAHLGTPVGIAIDGTTGFYVADPTASNIVATISDKINGPFAVPGGDVGNLGTRILIEFLPAVLAVS